MNQIQTLTSKYNNKNLRTLEFSSAETSILYLTFRLAWK